VALKVSSTGSRFGFEAASVSPEAGSSSDEGWASERNPGSPGRSKSKPRSRPRASQRLFNRSRRSNFNQGKRESLRVFTRVQKKELIGFTFASLGLSLSKGIMAEKVKAIRHHIANERNGIAVRIKITRQCLLAHATEADGTSGR
jgi:hypothetical protein